MYDLRFYAYSAESSSTHGNFTILIYTSRDRERLGFADSANENHVTPITNEDFTYGQKSTYTICNNGSISAFLY